MLGTYEQGSFRMYQVGLTRVGLILGGLVQIGLVLGGLALAGLWWVELGQGGLGLLQLEVDKEPWNCPILMHVILPCSFCPKISLKL